MKQTFFDFCRRVEGLRNDDDDGSICLKRCIFPKFFALWRRNIPTTLWEKNKYEMKCACLMYLSFLSMPHSMIISQILPTSI